VKPRLESADWTQEDKVAFNFRIRHQAGHGYHFWDMWDLILSADRRDADLMFSLENARARERAETRDGKPLSARAYAHSLMKGSQLVPELAPWWCA
jgi:hypothetical protein